MLNLFWSMTKRILTSERGTWVGTAIVGGAALVGSVAGAVISSDASRSAANKQSDAAQTSTNTQLKMYEEGRADTAPWRTAGANALTTLQQKINAGPGDYTRSPGYTFRLKQGEQALENLASARGMSKSGATAKALTQFNQDYATNDYQNFLANYYNSLTPYQSLAQVGQTTASQNAVLGNQVGANIGTNQLLAGQAQAGNSINQANIATGAINSGMNNYLMWKYLNGGGSSGGGVTPDLAEGPAYNNAASNISANEYTPISYDPSL